jgi:hypothetical protein
MGTGTGIGIGIPFRRMGAGIDPQAQAHYNRVIADGGLIPSGLVGVNNFFKTVKAIYGTSDITTAISVGLDAQVLGYKLGAGAGTTAGQAAQKLYSCSGSSGDVVQTTAASQPLLLVHEGANYLFCPNVTGNSVTTPNAAANQITGDLDIIAYLKHTSNGTLNGICSKNDSGSNRGYSFVFESNTLTLYYGTNSLNVASATSIVVSGSKLWVRCTRNSSTGDIKFYTSNNPVTTAISSISWTQLGATVSGLAGSLNSSGTLPLVIGGYISTSSGFGSQEQIYRLTISNSIGGTPVVDFNPNQYNAANSQTQWVSTSGETWTINTGTATTGYKGQIVTKTIVQGDGIDDVMGKNSAFTSTKNLSVYSAKKSFNIPNSNGYISSAVNPGEMVLSDISFFIGGSTFSPTGRSTLLQFSALRQSSSNTSKVRYNANADTSGTPTTVACNRIILFGSPYAWDYGTAQYSNNILSTVIITSNYDSDVTSTSIYNLLKSINNNAF